MRAWEIETFYSLHSQSNWLLFWICKHVDNGVWHRYLVLTFKAYTFTAVSRILERFKEYVLAWLDDCLHIDDETQSFNQKLVAKLQ